METPTQNMPEGGAEPQGIDTAPTEMMEQKPSFLGPLIGILIAVAILALGWLYFWPTTDTNQDGTDASMTDQPSDSPDGSARATPTPTSPEDLSDIEADLETEIADIDEDLKAIDAAFEEGP